MLDSGVVLGGRYRLDERIATGGMGDVWRGTDTVLGRRVAVKVLLPTLLADSGFLARFRAEARILAALRHPGIVQVFDYGEDELPTGRADYLVMEYVDGEPLSERIRATGRLDVAETLRVIAEAAQALHATHLRGIVHRDVKPSNLLVQADGTVRLLDFGVARSVEITSVTSSNAVPGTALYMAPEQATGRPVSAATDIYALGVVAYQCLAGQPPFTGDTPLQVAVKHLHEEPPPLPDDVPEPVAALIFRALAKDPADRYPSAAEFARAARAAASHPAVATGAAAEPGAPVSRPADDGPADEGTTAPADAAHATTVDVGSVAGPAATGGERGRSARAATTLADNPVVAVPEGRVGRSGVSPLTLAGVAAAVGVVAAVVTALIAFRAPDRAPATDPSPTPTVAESVDADTPRPTETETRTRDSNGEDDGPTRPRSSRSPTPTVRATSPSPDAVPRTMPPSTPSPGSEPTDSVPPSGEPEPTNPSGNPTNPGQP